MYLSSPSNGLDSLVFGVPLVALLVFGYFRLDEVFARKTRASRRPKEVDGVEYEPMGSDPDGRRWEKTLRRRY